MTPLATPRRQSARSILFIVTSISVSVAISLALDAVLVGFSTDAQAVIIAGAVLFNGTGILQLLVDGIIEWQRPGHAIGRQMMVAGPLYGVVAAAWATANTLRPLVDPTTYQVFSWAVALTSWPAAALLLTLTGVGLIASDSVANALFLLGPAFKRKAGLHKRGLAGSSHVTDERLRPGHGPGGEFSSSPSRAWRPLPRRGAWRASS